jgi:hypothetical protein
VAAGQRDEHTDVDGRPDDAGDPGGAELAKVAHASGQSSRRASPARAKKRGGLTRRAVEELTEARRARPLFNNPLRLSRFAGEAAAPKARG